MPVWCLSGRPNGVCCFQPLAPNHNPAEIPQ
jgi:hypothetical protein